MRRKLLLADDSLTVQRVIELTFSDEGLDIVTVGDGTRAIECLQRERPDIVLADLNMPGADGYEVAEHVKHGPDLVSHTRVVLLTGAFEPVDQERARTLGVDGVLAKPFEPQVAIALVRELLEQPPLSPPRVQRPATVASSDWTADLSAGSGTQDAAQTEQATTGQAPGGAASKDASGDATAGVPAVATGYPFEPGTGAPRSTPAELDDYFKRLDEALTSAGLMASPAVKHMLAESAGPKPAEPTPRPETTETVGEERQMSGMPSQGPVNVTLVDAFSALLAAEQGEGTGAVASFPFWGATGQPGDASTAGPGGDASTAPSGQAVSSQATSDVAAGASGLPSSHAEAATHAAPAGAAVTSAAAVTTTAAVTEAQIEAIVRRVVGEMADRIVREIANARVLDVAERLVREEIERLKADAESGAAQPDAAPAESRTEPKTETAQAGITR